MPSCFAEISENFGRFAVNQDSRIAPARSQPLNLNWLPNFVIIAAVYAKSDEPFRDQGQPAARRSRRRPSCRRVGRKAVGLRNSK
jgi:hypothetical protein